MESLNKKADNIYDINWCSFQDLEKNCEAKGFPYSSIRALFGRKFHYTEAGRKNSRNSTRYIANTIMANMAEFEYANVMTYCGTIGYGKMRNTPCGKWKYCDRCADTRRKFFYIKYANAYGQTVDPCYFITITVDVEDKVEFTEKNAPKLIEAWDKMNLYIDSMYKKKMIKGAVVVEEAAFDSYFPKPMINPHVHMLCIGTDGLRTHRFDGMKIHVKTINNAEHWVSELNYMNKCINFFHPYAQQWTKENAQVVNRNFRDMLALHKHTVINRNQSRAIGILHGKNKNALVKNTKEIREAYKPQKKNKRTRQKQPKKIQCTNMFEEFAAGAKSKLTEKVAAPVAQTKSRPWYKNPYILGGGALALGAGAYGLHRYFNTNTPAPTITPKPALPASTPEAGLAKATPDQVNDLKQWINSSAKPSPTIPRIASRSGKMDLGMVSDYLKKPEYKGEFPNVQGISPLRPELQAKGLSMVNTPREENLTKMFGKHFDAGQALANMQTRSRIALSGGDRAIEALPEFTGKTPEEIANVASGWDKHRMAFDKISPDTLKGTRVQPADFYTSDMRGMTRDLPSTQAQGTYAKATNAAMLPATVYDAGNVANMLIPGANKVMTSAGNATLGKGITGTVGKLNPALFPISAGITSLPSGYRIGQDIQNDPSGAHYKILESLGISPENMKYVTSGGAGAVAGGGTLLTNPATRGAIKAVLKRSLAAGATSAASTIELSPPVSIAAGLTSALAAPVSDRFSQSAVNSNSQATQKGNQYGNMFNNLLQAKKMLDSNNEAYALKGLLNSQDFRSLDTSPEGIKQLYAAVGEGPANIILTAKREGVMGLVGRKLKELAMNNKYRPVQ